MTGISAPRRSSSLTTLIISPNEGAQADHVGSPSEGRIHDLLALDHHSQVADAVAVAGHHHRYDILSYVVHIALYRSEQCLLLGAVLRAALPEQRREGAHSLFHHTGRLHHLRQKHLSLPEELAHMLHGGHEATVDHLEGRHSSAHGLQRIVAYPFVEPLHHRMIYPLLHGQRAPLPARSGLAARLFLSPDALGIGGQTLGGILPACQHHILGQRKELRFDLLVKVRHGRIDDPEVESRPPAVVQKHRVHRPAHAVYAAEGEREVADAAADIHPRQIGTHPFGRPDEVACIDVVLRNARRHGQHIGVEDDVLRRKARRRQQCVSPAGHLDLALVDVGLTALVEEHDHRRRTVTPDERRPAQEEFLALLERNGVHDRLALHALQSRLQHLPRGGVDHHGHACYLRLGGRHVEKPAHRRRPVDHPVVETDVDHLRTALYLAACHGERLLETSFADQFRKLGRPRHIGAFADIHESRRLIHHERFEAGEHRPAPPPGQRPGRITRRHLCDGTYVFGRGAAATAHDIDKPLPQVLLHLRGHGGRRLLVFSGEVREARIGIDRHRIVRHIGHPPEVGKQLPRTERTVEPDRQRPGMRHRGVEGLHGLPRERPPAVGERPRHDEGKPASARGEHLLGGEHGRLAVERIEKGLELDKVRTAVHQSLYLRDVGCDEPAEIDFATRRVVHVRGDGGGLARGSHRTAHETRSVLRMLPHVVVRRAPGHLRRRTADGIRLLLQPVVGERNAVGVERIRRHDVGSRIEVSTMYLPDHVGTGKDQQVVAPLQRHGPRRKLRTAIILLPQPVALYHGTHAAVQDDDPLPDDVV